MVSASVDLSLESTCLVTLGGVFAYMVFPFAVFWMSKRSTKQLVLFALTCWLLELVAPIWYVMTEPDGFQVDWNMNVPWFNFVRHNPVLRLPSS